MKKVLFLIIMLAPCLVFAWTGAKSAPPLGNISVPINPGSQFQYKTGGLQIGLSQPDTSVALGKFYVKGTSLADGVVVWGPMRIYNNGNVRKDNVFVSDLNGKGNWKSVLLVKDICLKSDATKCLSSLFK